ncbi:hypothetical protein BCR39DRAFT_86195 [Naematelia encephala]|uniref:Histone-lysine N-methyltransferase, H3 lysine-36 specific n=1 Tax=Naematelia encephala TaxID=71784 RepID=A0A1Y2B9T9_9TREE|nr:hypothetical protein BCR39DRAFT_86195 [Naematelia encephala]
MSESEPGGSRAVKLDPESKDNIDIKPTMSESNLSTQLFSPNSPKRSPSLALESKPSPPPLSRASSSKPIVPRRGPTLIDDLPIAWDEAHETFESLEKCVYEFKGLGLSREQDEMMVCDCVYDRHDPDATPCGPDSDCINRAIFIECLAHECRAKSQCRNQRFSKRQYAPVEIVLTEMKGYGLRAAADIPAGSLIYEYIGEVVAEKTFRKRMQLYAEEGIKHFYFMMLQKEEYIDATKKGGIGRFANHSCNPNSEVQKWVVGRRLRMGIFTKRDVVKGEEITFNYNVDRYGHDAQICYCGEPNCVGTIGGKTQTDIGGMNDLILEALGIADEVAAQEMKGNKKKKSRQLGDDFVPNLHPIEEHEAQKVAAALRQTTDNQRIMSFLLQRIKMTDDAAVHRQLMRMHGFSIMFSVLTQMTEASHIVLLALQCLDKWDLSARNKIDDSNIEDPVKQLVTRADENISNLAAQLLEHWSKLETSYRIPRKPQLSSLDAEDEAATTTIAEEDTRSARRPQAWENQVEIHFDIAPVKPRAPVPFARPKPPPTPRQASQTASVSAERLKLDAILAQAQQSVVAAAVSIPPPSPAAESSRSGSRTVDIEDDWVDQELRNSRKRQKTTHELSSEELEARKAKIYTKVIGELVVRWMSKYKEQMDHETFKRYAKECTAILVDKEKKGHSYASNAKPDFSEEKKGKMKTFVKEYAHKVLKRLKEKGKLRKQSSNGRDYAASSEPSATPATTAIPETPNGLNKEQIDLVSDIFGPSDELDSPSLVVESSPMESPLRNLKDASVTEKTFTNGFRVESLDMSGFKVHRTNSGAGVRVGIQGTPDRTPTSGSGSGPSPGQ